MFKIKKQKPYPRIGKITTAHGVITTPFFMPDATRGFIKSVDNEDLRKIKMGPIVVNTYHLYLQPGIKKIKKAGGIHKFMNWNGPILSDSGGFQVFSLIHKNPKMGKITDDGVIFKSPLDGAKHKLTPEKAIQIQFDLGVDMMVCLDDCPPNDYNKKKLKESVERTIAWTKRCRREYDTQIKKRKLNQAKCPLLFGVIQGGEELDLRKFCAEELIKIGFDGYGFGARHIDAKGNFLGEVLKYTVNLIPEDSLRFALGVGAPEDIVRASSYGWDMFDCVIPTREGRHGKLFLWQDGYALNQRLNKLKTARRVKISNSKFLISNNFYKTVNIANARFANDFSPINPESKFSELREHTKAYLHHLFKLNEPLGLRLASLNNLEFYLDLMDNIRKSV